MKNEALLKAVAKLVAREVSRLEEKLLNGASPVEQQASLVADSILDDLRQFNNTVPVFDEGSKRANPIVRLSWLKE